MMQNDREPIFRLGVIESIDDPLKLGRYRVRVAQIHTDNIGLLPTHDLPWAEVVQPVTSAAISGVGDTPRLLPGTWVWVSFIDAAKQKPLIWGTSAGIPGAATNMSPSDPDSITELVNNVPPAKPPAPVIQLPSGQRVTTDQVTSPLPSGSTIVEPPYIGSLTNSQVKTLKATIAQSETGGKSNPYAVENTIGFLGKYQFGSAFLKDQGYILKTATGLNKDIVDNPSNWSGKNGVTSKDVFFQAIAIQEDLMDKMLKNNYTILAKAGILDVNSDPAKTAGLLMAAHLKGAGGAIKYANGVDTADAYGTTTSTYYKRGYESITGVATNENPSVQNIGKPAIDSKSIQNQNALKYDVGHVAVTGKQGFQDPSGKYPLKNHLNESDLNRLARGSNINKTIVGVKEAERITGIPVALSSSSWSQSPIPYGAIYPNNRVISSESGHIFEFDDTPGCERINLHHASGTFYEVDHDGNATTRTKGVRTVIVEKDELVYIQGAGHVTIDGNHTLLVKNALNIQVVGNANIQVSGNCVQEVAGDYSLSANNITMFARGAGKFTSGASMEVGSAGSFTVGGSGIIGNTVGNLGAPILLTTPSSGSFVTAGTQTYSIQIPAPVTRQEVTDMKLEGAEDITSVIYADAPAPVKSSSDTTTPAQVIPVTGVCGFSDITTNLQLTTNYTLGDLCKDGAFPILDGQHNMKPEELACNLKQLAINVIEPLREKYATLGFKVNSCFRPAGSSISKSKNISQHELGCAVDIVFSAIRGMPDDRERYFKLAQEIRDSVPFDQMLLEYRSSGSVWIHISYSNNLRRQVLTMYNDKVYDSGLHLLV